MSVFEPDEVRWTLNEVEFDPRPRTEVSWKSWFQDFVCREIDWSPDPST